MEYRYHKKQMHYSSRLDFILKYELGNLIEMVRAKEDPFNKNYRSIPPKIYKTCRK